MTSGSRSSPRRDSGTRPQRLLIVVTLTETGGAQTYVRELLPAFVGEFDVTVAGYGNGPLATSARAAGATFIPLHHVRRSLHPIRDLLGLLELYRLVRRIRPDVMHLNSSKAGILGAVAGGLGRVPVRVFTAHGWAFKGERGARGVLFRVLHRLVRPLITCVICVSQAELRAGLEARACTETKAVVIPNGVAERSPSGGPRAGIVTITRLRPPKDTLTLVAAVARAKDLPALTIVGDGPDRRAVESAISAAGLADRVALVGDVDDPGSYLERAAVFVLSTRSEGMPMAVLEAMAAGVPVVASAVGGIPELIRDGESGLLVPPGDTARLAAALERVSHDRELASRFAEAARHDASVTFSVDRFRESHRVLYSTLLGAGRR
jgi:glycosyltransferase involved in cell wall biosynthesis